MSRHDPLPSDISLERIADALDKIEESLTKIETDIDGTPTWHEILMAKTLTQNGITYTVITQGDEGYIRVEAVASV